MASSPPATVRDTLVQAVLPTPMFASRWRWNLTRSLVSPRDRGSRRVPPAIQRMEADDLMAAIFPALAACQENVSGPIEIPGHPIVRQTLDDCCTEAMDLEGLTDVLARVRSGHVQALCVDTVIPSVLAEEILNGRPYTFLDDAPLEERRTRAVTTRRGLPLEAHDLAALDPGVVARITGQASPELRNAEELHDLLCSLVLAPARPEWSDWMDALARCGRSMTVELPAAGVRWVATECRELATGLVGGARFHPDHRLEGRLAQAVSCSRDEALVAAARGHLEVLGPVTLEELSASIGTGTVGELRSAVACLEAEGSVLGCRVAADGQVQSAVPAERFCARHLLARIHAAMRDSSRRSVEAVSAQQFMRFLLSWQHVGPGHRLLGSGGVVEVIEQLQGYEAAVDAWEAAILPVRVAGYHAGLLDEWCGAGRGRLRPTRPAGRPVDRPAPARRCDSVAVDSDQLVQARGPWVAPRCNSRCGGTRPADGGRRPGGGRGTSASRRLVRHRPLPADGSPAGRSCRGALGRDGPRAAHRGRLPGSSCTAERARCQGATSSFPGRAGPVQGPAGRTRPGLPRPGRSRLRVRPAVSGGRWSLLGDDLHDPGLDPDDLAEAIAGRLLSRGEWSSATCSARESLAVAWRDVIWALRRLEARGVVLGGRHVAGFAGEQFALPEAVERLREVARSAADGVEVQLSATDPLNLTGVILPGPRIPAQHSRTITLKDGVLERPAVEGSEVEPMLPRQGAIPG